jgi:hypothetical protein
MLRGLIPNKSRRHLSVDYTHIVSNFFHFSSGYAALPLIRQPSADTFPSRGRLFYILIPAYT